MAGNTQANYFLCAGLLMAGNQKTRLSGGNKYWGERRDPAYAHGLHGGGGGHIKCHQSIQAQWMQNPNPSLRRNLGTIEVAPPWKNWSYPKVQSHISMTERVIQAIVLMLQYVSFLPWMNSKISIPSQFPLGISINISRLQPGETMRWGWGRGKKQQPKLRVISIRAFRITICLLGGETKPSECKNQLVLKRPQPVLSFSWYLFLCISIHHAESNRILWCL